MTVNFLTIYCLQVLQKRLDEVKKSTETLSERLDKAREENDDLRFQVSRNQKSLRTHIHIATLFKRIPKKYYIIKCVTFFCKQIIVIILQYDIVYDVRYNTI